MRSMLSMVGSLAMMVGGVIVFQPASASVRQRRRAFGLFTGVGITRSTQGVLCLVEVAVLAGAVPLPGWLAGRWLAALDGRVVVGAIGEIWLKLGAKVQLHSFSSGLLAALLRVGVALAAATLALHVFNAGGRDARLRRDPSVHIDPATVVSITPAEPYEVLPQGFGLAQLVATGVLERRGGLFFFDGYLYIGSTIPRFPAGLYGAHLVFFVL